MTKRKLTEEEKKLWQRYTCDVKKLSSVMIMPDLHDNKTSASHQKRFDVQVPKKAPAPKKAFIQFSNHETLKDKDQNWSKKLKGGKIKPEGKIDLHGMTCAEAHEKLHKYLDRAQRFGKRVILVITGKGGPKREYDAYRFRDFENGHGVLKREVPMWLSGGTMRHMVVSFQDAQPSDGGGGALYVILKRLT